MFENYLTILLLLCLYMLLVKLIIIEKKIIQIFRTISRKQTTYNSNPYVNIVKPIKK
jgi:hypothetical protein